MTATFAFLGLLYKQSGYGYDLKKTYDALFGREKPLAFGQVYATLARMARNKQIDIDQAEQASGPERKRYVITPKGREELAAWLGKPELAHPGAQADLFVKVATAMVLWGLGFGEREGVGEWGGLLEIYI